ncbi:hypothetical protein GCM10017083_06680 [Thalassobaculum fulvum]|uniref:Uncharacterized protein n=1 Tax=Thalassobaculum fulvum TaxID=1633335 RepID=A0A918XPF9_9PROT|nr:hypothetical protein GCM10017083_06680 [Thalassobaculum fulvum]
MNSPIRRASGHDMSGGRDRSPPRRFPSLTEQLIAPSDKLKNNINIDASAGLSRASKLESTTSRKIIEDDKAKGPIHLLTESFSDLE